MARTPEAGAETTTSGPMTPALYALIVLALVLSVAHHVDHVLRGDTGWPLAGAFNAFSASLVIYPLILTGLLLSVLGKVGPRFWAGLSLGGGLFVAAVHLGPVATDTIAGIPSQYESPVAGGLAVALLVALIGVLVGTFAYEVRLATRHRPVDPQRASVVRRAAAFTLLACGFLGVVDPAGPRWQRDRLRPSGPPVRRRPGRPAGRRPGGDRRHRRRNHGA
jgi:hypothetical protein